MAVNLPDPKKGERVVLLLAGEMDGDAVRRALIEAGSNPLTVPAEFLPVEQVPKLGSGKTDFAAVRRLALSLSG